MSEESATGWERLGEYVVARRARLGYRTQAALGAAVGVTSRVIGDIEVGRRHNFSRTTLSTLERVLEWGQGSARLVVRGGEPLLVSEEPVRADGRCRMSTGCRHYGMCRLAAALERGTDGRRL